MKTSLKLLAFAVLAASLGTQAHATSITWNNSSTSWSTGSSWVGGTAPVNDLTTDTAVFNNTTFNFQPSAGTTSIAGITVGDGVTTTGALTFTSTALTIGSGGITVTGNGLTAIGLVTLPVGGIKLGANQTWTNNAYSSNAGVGALKGSVISNGSASPVTLTLAGSGTSLVNGSGLVTNMDLQGAITDGVGMGAISIVGAGTGAGVINLSNSGNTFSGGVTIKSGTVSLTTASAAGTGTITLGDSSGSTAATLRAGSVTTTNAITVAAGSSGTLSIEQGGNATPTFAGAVTMNNNLKLAFYGVGTGSTMSGGFSGTGNLTVSNSGSAPTFITNNINMTGMVTNNGASTGDTYINSVIGSNVTGVTQNSSGSTLFLGGANTYSGDTVLTLGTVTLATAAANSSLTGTWAIDKTAVTGMANTTGLVVGQRVTGTGIAANTVIVATSANGVTLSTKTTAAGTAAAMNFEALAGSIANSALDTTGAGTMTVTGTTELTLGGLKNSGTARNLSSVVTTGYSAVTDLTLNPGTGKTNSYSGNITNGAAGMTLTKTGLGTQVLSGTNSYTGVTTVSAGTLLVSSTGSLAAGSAVTVQSSAAIGGDGAVNGNLTLDSGAKFVFDLNNTELTVGGIFALNNSFGVASLVDSSLVAIDWSAVGVGTYKLIGTNFAFDATKISNFGSGNALPTGGKEVYFTSGSNLLNVVVAVPEPATWALLAGSLTTLVIFRRRRRA